MSMTTRTVSVVLRIAVAVGLGCGFSGPMFAQVALNLKDPSAAEFKAVLASLPSAQREAIKESAAKVFPVFVFLPGVMGSKLTKALPDGKTKLIWGELNGVFSRPDKDLQYSESDIIKVDVLDEYYALGRSVDIYGTAVNTIKAMDLTAGKTFFPFAYDWRQPNAKSAQEFSKWLCGLKTEIAPRPVVFIAHSMGGLILKHWLKNTYDSNGCAGDNEKFENWIKVKKVIFLGTPHFGAPKAITAFADKHYLLVDPDSLSGKIFGGLDAKYLSGSVNEYGATFPSAYELLPIVNTTGNCLNRPAWPSSVNVQQPDGNVHANIDLFNPYMWQVFKWPRQLSSDIPRRAFVETRLPALLASAKAFLCGLAEYEPQKRFNVMRFYGNNKKTVCSVTIVQAKKEADLSGIKLNYCDEMGGGDGTVPMWVAAEKDRVDADDMRSATNGHAELLASGEFINYLRSYRDQLHRELQASLKDKNDHVDGLTKMYAALRYVVPSAPNAAENDISATIARSVLASLSVSPKSLYTFAKTMDDSLARSNVFRVVADTAATGDVERPWALNNAAHILLSQGMYGSALDLGRNAVMSLPDVPASADIKGKAALITAVAAEKLKNESLAKTFGAIAFGAGNLNAARFVAGN